jgi:L-threonylcarbamoyladenylate synthase
MTILAAGGSGGAAAIERAAHLLRAGRLVADDRAVAAIFAAKRRPRFNPLIVHVEGVGTARVLARWSDRAEQLAARFWPGALTLILPRAADCPLSLLVSAGADTVGLRWPAHPIAQALLEQVGLPVAAPSANPAGRVSPTTARHVAAGLGVEVDLILDGGACAIGVESTVLDLAGAEPRLLRPGGVTRAELEAVLGPLASGTAAGEDGLRSPGQLASHYAPRRPLRLDACSVAADEALLAFGPEPLAGAAVTLNLSPQGDLVEAAANLFAMLHALDRPEICAIAAMPVPAEGLGEAIRDRLARAAA